MHNDGIAGQRWLGVLALMIALLVQQKHAERPLDIAGVDAPTASKAGKGDSGKASDSNESIKLQHPNRSEDSSEACANIFKDPRNWQVFPRVGRALHWSATPEHSIGRLHYAFLTDGIASAFRGFPDVIQKTKSDSFTNVFLRPGVDVILRFGLDLQSCPWTGELSLSTYEDCRDEGDENEDKASELVRSYTQKGLHIFRLALPKKYLVAQFKDDEYSFSDSLEAKDIQYFLCMKPGGQNSKAEALHFFWYKRDADGQSVKTIFSTPFKDILSDWIFKDSLVMDKPLSKELIFGACQGQRWSSYEQARHTSASDEIRIHAALRALHDDCSFLSSGHAKMAPHSAMLLCFQRRRSSDGARASDNDSPNVASVALLHGAVVIVALAMSLPDRIRRW